MYPIKSYTMLLYLGTRNHCHNMQHPSIKRKILDCKRSSFEENYKQIHVLHFSGLRNILQFQRFKGHETSHMLGVARTASQNIDTAYK